MITFKFTLNIEYEVEAENEEEAVYEVVEIIRKDWIYYADEGDFVETS